MHEQSAVEVAWEALLVADLVAQLERSARARDGRLHAAVGSERMEGLFEDLLRAGPPEGRAWSPAVDVEETDDAWVVEAELPGVTKNDLTPGELDAERVDAHLGEGVLTIRVPEPERAQPRRIEIEGG